MLDNYLSKWLQIINITLLRLSVFSIILSLSQNFPTNGNSYLYRLMISQPNCLAIGTVVLLRLS